jgi:hypothetical protein
MVSALVGDAFVDIVMLEGVTPGTAAGWAGDGMMIV